MLDPTAKPRGDKISNSARLEYKNNARYIFCIFILNITYLPIYAEVTKIEGNNDNKNAPIESFLGSITSVNNSPLENKLQQEKCINNNQHLFYLYNINYMMPYYYTSSPYDRVYNGFTPDNQKLNNSEFKGQISVGLPLVKNFFGDEKKSIDTTFTETVFWQFYADSQYFRSTDTEINALYKFHFYRNWLFYAGPDHQSNGKGGIQERSWNRIIGSLQFSGENFSIQTEGWGLIFQAESADLHNPDIEKYLGHDRITLAYKLNPVTVSLSAQNIERPTDYMTIRATVSLPINDTVNLYAEYFNGYGQSLLEYNHLTQGFGIGGSFNSFL